MYAKILRNLFWGKPGQFWYELAEATSLYIKGDDEAASNVITKWQKPSTPKSFRDYANSYRLTGYLIRWQWSRIIGEFEEIKNAEKAKLSSSLLISASRAYAELGQVDEATACLEQSNLAESRLGVKSIALLLLPFFSLTGARAEVEKILAIFVKSKQDLPEYSRLYWLGRCLAVNGETAQAREAFNRALLLIQSQLPDTNKAWQHRLDYQITRVGEVGIRSKPDLRDQINRVWNLFQRAALVEDIVSPKNGSRAVAILVVTMIAAYLITNPYSYYKNDLALALSISCLEKGALIPQLVLEGQYWRLITYLFMHQHISHCLLNAIGLYWFGRIAESIYGTSRFLAIYLVSGIISGITHVMLAPSMAAVGASGAVMGIFGAVAVGIFRMKDNIPESVRRTELIWMFGLMIAQIMLDQIIPHVAVFAHLGGLMAGIALALILPLSGIFARVRSVQ